MDSPDVPGSSRGVPVEKVECGLPVQSRKTCIYGFRSGGVGQDAGVPRGLESKDIAIMRACELLAETSARFHVGGFGADDWNLDVTYDLSVFLEQLAVALGELNAGKENEIALYSQGVERVLVFRPQGAGVRIECISGTSWKPDPAEEEVTSWELISMLTQLAVDFSGAVVEADGDAAQVEPISSWLRGIILQCSCER